MSDIAEAHELSPIANEPWDESHDFDSHGQDFSLPPADGGRQAWIFLAVCFLLEATVWGFPFAFGVFQKYYASADPFKDDSTSIAAVGTTATGIMYFASPLVIGFTGTFPHRVRPFSAFGLVVMLLGIVCASFANSVWQLLITQGVMYGIGGSLLYLPSIVYLDEWFIRRKGLAFGIMWAGTGTSGMIIPLLMQWLLDDYGFRTALRVWAVISAMLLGPSLFYLKGRLPVQRPGVGTRRRIDLGFCRTSTFWVLQAGNIIQGLGYFIPSIYLPSYAKAIGLSNEASSVTVSLINAAAVVGVIAIGALVDRVEVSTAIMIASVGATLACLIVWGLSTSLASLYVFAVMYGAFAGGYAAAWPGIAMKIREHCRDDNGVSRVDTGMVLALLAAGKGIGAVVSGPLSEVLLEADQWRGKTGARE
ncbi:hypothetical protein N0V90_004108 [Kalmusia sp. IMI 367209]|nr:hypothetical protein N0V90_004108 [Kalmusia sp. IMI 367209]